MNLIDQHPVLDYENTLKKKQKVSFTLDGETLRGFEGDPIAMALHANRVFTYRITPKMGRARGFFCAIGKCSSCFMIVDGTPNVRTCITPLVSGMKVQTQQGKGSVIEKGDE